MLQILTSVREGQDAARAVWTRSAVTTVPADLAMDCWLTDAPVQVKSLYLLQGLTLTFAVHHMSRIIYIHQLCLVAMQIFMQFVQTIIALSTKHPVNVFTENCLL